jgi:hypothetical protein
LRQYLFSPVLLLAALCLALPDAGYAVLRFDTAEIVLHSTSAFDGSQGFPNPFTEVELTAEVTSPSGKIYSVDGFFDGDGAGGQVGDVFKVRVFADEPGSWSWTTASDTSGLDGQSGSFQVSGTLAGFFGRGPIEADPQRPRAFRSREGGAVYLLAKYLDKAAPPNLQFSHTLFSEQRSEADRQALLDRHAGMKLNKINVYVANQGDYGNVATTPWLGTAAANDKTRFDLARWLLYERWLRQMRDSGFAVQLWFFADNSGFGDLPDADRKRLIRFAMARLSGYGNTLFTLMTEWQEGWTAAEVGSTMDFLQSHNPWRRLATVHGVPGDFSFPNAAWADYLLVQTGVETALTPEEVHAATLENRALAAKPLMQEEFCLGQETDKHRQMAWAAFTAGAAGTGTGAFLRPLAEFIATLPFERLAPADGLVLSGGAWALAEPGAAYVLYLYGGGSATLDLGGVSGIFEADWFDPRTGAFQEAPSVSGGGARTFTAPGTGDWALRLVASEETPLSGHDFYTLSPCRLVDTRQAGQGPALVSSETRQLVLTGKCGVPADARALSLQVTAVGPSAAGYLSFSPTMPVPATSTVTFAAGSTRSNNAILPLAPDGSGRLIARAFVADGGAVHVVVDVTGFFR